MESETAIAEAIKCVGGAAALGKLLGESTQTVTNWRARGEAPANRCAAIEQHTKISRKRLRSDWFDYWPELATREQAQPTPTPAEERA